MMTGLADLCHREKSLSYCKYRTNRQLAQVNAGSKNILGKISRMQLCALLTHGIDGLVAQKTHLTVPVSGMRIAFDTFTHTNLNGLNGLFACTLFHADAAAEHRTLCSGFHVLKTHSQFSSRTK